MISMLGEMKQFLRKKNHAYKNFLRKGGPANKLEDIKLMISEGAKMIGHAKTNYLRKAGQTLADPGTSSNTYYSLINAVLDKTKIPTIPLLL